MRVGIIGAGPAGSVCAIALLRGARERGQAHEVLMFDGKSYLQAGPQGCNMCAGVISTALFDSLGEPDPARLAAITQRYIDGYCFDTQVGGLHLPKEPEVTLCTVFRSAGPRGDEPDVAQSFDSYLLTTAEALGTTHISAHVAEVVLPKDTNTPFHITTLDHREFDVDVLVGAFGVNSALAKRFEQLGFGYRRPRTYHVCQAEFPLPPEFIDRTFQNEIKIFSLALPGIRFGALTPKRRHVTVTAIGRHVRQADLERFVTHPNVRQYFPPGWAPPASYCHCHPHLPVTSARHAVSDRLMIIGDAYISRYLKGGIESAFFTATLAAEGILAGTLTRRALQRAYVRPCQARYGMDNAWGRFLFFCNDVISHLQSIARAGLWLLRREQHMPEWENRPHTRLLWHIFAGDAPYRRIALDAISPRALLALLRAMFRREQ